jgi:hypothetical protein
LTSVNYVVESDSPPASPPFELLATAVTSSRRETSSITTRTCGAAFVDSRAAIAASRRLRSSSFEHRERVGQCVRSARDRCPLRFGENHLAQVGAGSTFDGSEEDAQGLA